MSKLSPGSNKFATRVKPEALEKDVRQFRGNLEKIEQNCGILQVLFFIFPICVDLPPPF